MKINANPQAIGEYARYILSFCEEMQHEIKIIHNKTISANGIWKDKFFTETLTTVENMRRYFDAFTDRSQTLAHQLMQLKSKMEQYLQ